MDYPEEFESYWKKHEQSLIEAAPKALADERKNNGKMNTAGDWLLFIIPIVAGVGFMNSGIIKSELLGFIVGIIIMVVCFGLAMMLKPYVTGKRSIVDIDADIKAYFFAVYQKEGVKGLEKTRA